MVPKRNTEVVWRLEKGMHEIAWDKARKDEEYEDLGVLTLMVKGSIHQLNLVGAEIWTRIDGIRSTEKIAKEIAGLFGWEQDETREAVLEFLKGIGEREWVTLPGDSAPAPPKWTGR